MSLGILAQFPNTYQVETDIYQGPLDLLLQLIEKAELDITKLALAQVTDQYLAYIKTFDHLQTNEISVFIVIAAKLLQIKSSVLLPKPRIIDEESTDIGDELVQQLIEYKKVRQVAQWLAEREARGLRTYLRIAPPPKMEGKIDLTSIDINMLLSAARIVFTQLGENDELEKQLIQPIYSIRNKIQFIISRLQQEGSTTFLKLINHKPTRVEIMITFLALLELIKQKQIEVYQENLFSDIVITPTMTITENSAMESEFDD
ncbi:MAG: segregation and condensation protein A [Anaerolineales bacterium]